MNKLKTLKAKTQGKSIMGRMADITQRTNRLNEMQTSKLTGKDWFNKYGKK